MNRLLDKIALITGASDGIGFELAKSFAAESATVVMLDRNHEMLATKSRKLMDQGHTILPVHGDVGCTEDVQRAVQAAMDSYGRLDVLVNNAAVAIPGDITDQSEADWNHLLNINLLGIFRSIKFALPGMLSRKSGSIINIASLQGDRSWDHWTTYAAAKGAVKAMTRQLAGQYGPQGVRFNSISPGAMRTPMNMARWETEGETYRESCSRMHALARIGEAHELNGAAIFLASEESAFVTGIDLLVDGGVSVLARA